MNKLIIAAAALSLAVPSLASAQSYDHQSYDHQRDGREGGGNAQQEHRGWGQDRGGGGHNYQRGERMGYNDWSGAPRVDYREHHLRRPGRGYEWREYNGQYVLAAIATGLVASAIINSGR
jgi:Ni/Co efflux regulator RcnB